MKQRVRWINTEHTYRGQKMFASEILVDGKWVCVDTVFAYSSEEAKRKVTGEDTTEW